MLMVKVCGIEGWVVAGAAGAGATNDIKTDERKRRREGFMGGANAVTDRGV